MIDKIDLFVNLAPKLLSVSDQIVDDAVCENPWFSPDSVRIAALAIAQQMLDRQKLCLWIEKYPDLPVSQPKKIGVVAAGNIPMVSFFDLLCVVVSGHRCVFKPSSKDKVLMSWIINSLNSCGADIEMVTTIADVDAIIVTGGDGAGQYYRENFGSIPSIIRGSRHSVAVLSDSQTTEELQLLSADIFTHCGLGCRNVSEIFIPRQYDVMRLKNVLSKWQMINNKYINNYKHAKATMMMSGAEYVDGGFFIMHENCAVTPCVAEIILRKYDTITEVDDFLKVNEQYLQCVVCKQNTVSFQRQVGFGNTQFPTLNDYSDGVDTMKFLKNF